MTRWTRATLVAFSLAVPIAFAQGFVREAPRDVQPGVIAVSATPPLITVDGQEARLSPGARVRDRNNMLVLSGSLAGQTLYTVYRRDAGGLVHEVWLLNEEEYSRVGGKYGGDAEGHKRFAELLNLVWGARSASLLR